MLADAAYQSAPQAGATRKMAWALLQNADHAGVTEFEPPRIETACVQPTGEMLQITRLRREVEKWAALNGDAGIDVSSMIGVDDLRHAAKTGRLRYRAAEAAQSAGICPQVLH